MNTCLHENQLSFVNDLKQDRLSIRQIHIPVFFLSTLLFSIALLVTHDASQILWNTLY